MDLIRSLTCVSASHLRLVRDDDSHIDRLSHRYTVVICVIFAIIVTTKQYAGDPIAQFKASYEKYADSYCWIAGSWYTPMDKELPLSERERRSNRIRYYQWVPFLLLFQAILCYIPRIIWRTLNVRSGLDIINLVDAAIKYESVDKFSDRDKIMEYIVRNIERYIGARRSRYERLYGRQLCAMHHHHQHTHHHAGMVAPGKPHRSRLALCCCRCWIRIKIAVSTVCFWTGKRLGNYLVVLYMFVKTLWLTNAVSQLFLLNRFIGNDYHAFGIEIIEMLMSGQEWHELRHFPRVTYCDFKIREIGNQHDWTVQCVLRINLFNEVIYIFMWFWLCILALCSFVDYVTWTLRIIIPRDKLGFVKRHLDVESYVYGPSSKRKSSAAAMMASQKRVSTIENKSPSNAGLHHRMSRHSTAVSGSSQQTAAAAAVGAASVAQEAAENEVQNGPSYFDIEREKRLMREFTFSYLKDDGIFALRIMASSASDLIVTEIISELWKNFKLNYEHNSDEMSTLVSSPSSSSSSSGSSSSSATHSQAPSPASNQQSPSSMIKKQPFNFQTNPSSSQSASPPKLTPYSCQPVQSSAPPPPPPTTTLYSSPSGTTNIILTNPNSQSPLLNSNGNPRQYSIPSGPFTGGSTSPPIIASNMSMLPPLPPPQQQQTSNDPPSIHSGDRRSSYGLSGGNKDLFSPTVVNRHNSTTHHELVNVNPNAKDTHV